jgi:hypothetical protein
MRPASLRHAKKATAVDKAIRFKPSDFTKLLEKF